MCVSPKYIRNTSNVLGCIPRDSRSRDTLEKMYDTSNMLAIPCGKCSECKAAQLNKYLDACLFYSIGYYPFLLSCSIKDKYLRYSYGVSYADTSFVNRFFRNLVNRGLIPKSDYHYIGVTERGSKRGRPHFHFLLFLPKSFVRSQSCFLNKPDEFYQNEFCLKVKDFWDCYAVNIGSRKHPVYDNICDYVVRGRKRSFSLDPIVGRMDKSLYYVLKYKFKGYAEFPSTKLYEEVLRGTRQGIDHKNTCRNKLLFSRGFHNWIYKFSDSDFCSWRHSDLYNCIWPHFRLPDVDKPLSLRSVKKILNLHAYVHVISVLKNSPFDLERLKLRIIQNSSRLYEDSVYTANHISFEDSLDFSF